ncbi:RodZ domain-containing protein [Litoribacillus peritrichatus]|uniref:DUF4115 domain-containing protein n=1 Tax=Litoribacillus peritrichatus TaxID=718191 RepID=A0ABP7M127_9GAMM
MADDQTTEVTTKSTLPVGKILASARTEQGLSTDMVAARLCLTESYIKALENGNYAALPGDTFIRGYLRNYADMVGLNGEELVRLYLEQQGKTNEEEAARIKAEKKENRKAVNPLLILAVLVVVVGVLIFTLVDFEESPAEPENAPSAEQVETSLNDQALESVELTSEVDNSDAAESAVDVVAPSVDTEAQEETEPATPAAPLETTQITSVVEEVQPVVESVLDVPADDPTADLPKDTLSFTFMGDCWYQVIDATGTKLAERSKFAGDSSEVEGVPPFTVTIGDTTVVKLAHNGNAVDLSPYFQKKTARFKLGN